MLERHLGHHLELAAEVEQEGPVADLAHGDARDRGDLGGDPVGVVRVRGVAGDVDDDGVGVRLDDVEGGERPAGGGDRRSEDAGRVDGRRAPTARTVMEYPGLGLDIATSIFHDTDLEFCLPED